MKVDEVPQDLKFFKNTVVRDVDYALDADGTYKAVVSDGWDVKAEALGQILGDIDDQSEEVRQEVLQQKASPLAYHMVRGYLDASSLAANSGVGKSTVKKDLADYDAFFSQKQDVLEAYASALRISLAQLLTVPGLETTGGKK